MLVKCIFILFYSSLIASIPNNLTVEYLVVIDSTVYNNFVSLFGNLNDSSMRTYISVPGYPNFNGRPTALSNISFFH
jgi:hypothetical protein